MMELTPQEENLIKRLRTFDESSLYQVLVFVTPEKMVGFWFVEKMGKTEGNKRDIMPVVKEREMA
jgi:hypothetical protein